MVRHWGNKYQYVRCDGKYKLVTENGKDYNGNNKYVNATVSYLSKMQEEGDGRIFETLMATDGTNTILLGEATSGVANGGIYSVIESKDNINIVGTITFQVGVTDDFNSSAAAFKETLEIAVGNLDKPYFVERDKQGRIIKPDQEQETENQTDESGRPIKRPVNSSGLGFGDHNCPAQPMPLPGGTPPPIKTQPTPPPPKP